MKKFIHFFLTSLLGFSYSLHAAATWNDGQTANQLAAAIEGVGLTITNPVITRGTPQQLGVFADGINGAGLEVDEGIVLTTMTVEQSFHENSTIQFSQNHNTVFDDPDLTGIDARARFNPVIFEFDVTLDERTRLLIIDYQFASEEYHEYVGSQYNDAFGFFISGGDLPQTYNIARVTDNQTYVSIHDIDDFSPVAVNNVNLGVDGEHADGSPRDYTNAAFFIDNNQNNDGGTSPVEVEYDGLTVRLNATLDQLTPGETYHVKMAIADTADSNLNTGVFINKIRGLREPSFCYDYSFKQDGRYITNDHNDSSGPKLVNDAVTSSPIEMGMYIKNTETSEIIAENISLTFFNFDTTQVEYASNTVYVTNPGESYAIHIPDGTQGMTTSASDINNIPVASFDSLEHFYTYVSLNPQKSELDLPINANLNYTITIPLSPTQNINVPRFTTIDEDIPFCDGSLTEYLPTYGVFNIVQQELGVNTYNLLTQVTQRAGQYSLVALDEVDLETPKNISTIVGVSLVSLDSFHSTDASCNDVTNMIGQKQWYVLNNTSTLNFAQDFPRANDNVAFRVSVNLTNDGDDSLVQITDGKKPGNIQVLNFSHLTQELDTQYCAGQQFVYNPQSGQMTNIIPVACGNAGTVGISPEQLAACMECLFGYNVQNTCSRDNFSIRPEAFKIVVDDNAVPISQNYSGVTTPLTNDLELAAGYDYDLTVRAVHYDDISGEGDSATEASIGYDHSAEYTLKWNPAPTRTVTGCNDTTDTTINLNFNNGVATLPQDFKLQQAGRYSLEVDDSEWTRVDWDPAYRGHHAGVHFTGTTDCTVASNNVITEGSDLTNGCDISSVHTHPDSNVQYQHLPLMFRPYTFDLTQVQFTLGPNNIGFVNPAGNFVYNETLDYVTANFANTMSVQYSGPVRAVGYDNIVTSNFVDDCYSEPVTIIANTMDINHPRIDDANQDYLYRFRFHNLDINGAPIPAHDNDFGDALGDGPGQVIVDNAGAETIQIQLPQDRFQQNQQGILNPYMTFNFDKNLALAANPIQLAYLSTYQNVRCTTPQDCQFLANSGVNMDTDSANATPNIVVPAPGLNNVTHYYGRSFTPRQSYTTLVGNAPIFYEAYCDVNNGCNPALLQGTDISEGGDTRWRMNPNHTFNYGTAGVITQKNANAVTANPASTGNLPDGTTLTYDNSRGRPYTATMQHNPDRWLVYDPYNNPAVPTTTNQFQAEFIGGNANWAGKSKTDNNTETDSAQRSNRKLVW